VILRHGLYSPLVLGGSLSGGALGRAEHRVGVSALQVVVGVPNLEQFATDLREEGAEVDKLGESGPASNSSHHGQARIPERSKRP
jgi:hypothetical protein